MRAVVCASPKCCAGQYSPTEHVEALARYSSFLAMDSPLSAERYLGQEHTRSTLATPALYSISPVPYHTSLM